MTEPRSAPARPTRMRAAGLVLTAALLTGCGGPADDASPPEPATTSASPTLPGATSPGPATGAVPHEDQGVSRTGEVPTRITKCVLDGSPRWAFDGTVTAIDDGRVTFEVHESFRGDLPATYVVEMGAPVTAGHSEASPSYAVGTRLLVSGSGSEAWGCGGTLYYDAGSAADWRS